MSFALNVLHAKFDGKIKLQPLAKITLAFILSATFPLVAMKQVQADELEQARNIERQTNKASQLSQKKIDKNSDASFALQADIEQLQSQIENLSLYRDHLQKMVNSQTAELASFQRQIDGIAHTRQGIVPLMYHMLDGLESILVEDVPVRQQARQKRLDALKELMGRADVSEAEKYRRILEAYQIEIDYGTKLGAYQAEITLPNQEVRQAQLLHLGRVSLAARTLNSQAHWYWSKAKQQWLPVTAELGLEINKAFAMAEKQRAPEMLHLPLSLNLSQPFNTVGEKK